MFCCCHTKVSQDLVLSMKANEHVHLSMQTSFQASILSKWQKYVYVKELF